MASEWHETTRGFYAALGLTFDAPHEDVKRAYRRASLKYHPDRNRGDGAEEAKRMFQVVNSAFECLSEPARRSEYDGIFRMRCVLEQGRITEQMLHERELDCVYMFAVLHHKAIGLKEENVLVLNLGSGLEGASVERIRNGEVVESRPLSTVRSAEAEPGSAAIKLLLRDLARGNADAGRSSTAHFTARSPSDAASICTLLRALISLSLTGKPQLAFRSDDHDMPPPARMAGWLTVRTSQKFGGLSRQFALLGRSKLLMFSDRTCTTLRQLLTLEASALRVAHRMGERELELQLGTFRLGLGADSAFVAEQWAQAITEANMAKGLFLDPSEQPPTELHRHSSSGVAAPMDPFDPPLQPVATRKGSGSATRIGAAADVEVADLLGDLSAGDSTERPDPSLEELHQLYSLPAAQIDASQGGPCEPASPTATRVGGAAAAAESSAPLPVEPHQEAPAAPPVAPPIAGLSPFMAAVHEIAARERMKHTQPPPSSLQPAGQRISAEPEPFIDWSDAPSASGGSGTAHPMPSARTLLDEGFATNALSDSISAPLAQPPLPSSSPPPPLHMLLDELLPDSLPTFGIVPPPPPPPPPSMAELEKELLSTFIPPTLERRRHLVLVKPHRAASLGLRLHGAGSRVTVLDVAAGSLSESAGLRRGDRLLKVGGLPVISNEQVAQWLSQAQGATALLVESDDGSLDCQSDTNGQETSGGNAQAGTMSEDGAEATPVWQSVELTPPSVPFAENCGPDSLAIEWQLPAWAERESDLRFELQWRADGAAEWFGSPSSAVIEATRAVLHKLRLGTAYWVRVRTVGKRAASRFSQSLLPIATAPMPPEAFPVPDNVVHLIFEPVSTASRYELQWRRYCVSQSAEEGWESNEGSTRLRGSSVKKRNLEPGQRFEFRVRAISEEGLPTPFSAPSIPVLVGDPAAHFDLLERERRAANVQAATDATASRPAADELKHYQPRATESPGFDQVYGGPPLNAALEQLMALGLSAEDAARALRDTGGKDVAAAADWYFSHQADFETARRARASDDVERLLDGFL